MNKKTVIFDEYIPPTESRDKGTVGLRPTETQIVEIEKKLSSFLTQKHPELFRKYNSYFRQYGGYKTGGSRGKIYANFMCPEGAGLMELEWRKDWISVDDGGDCYFDFWYDLDKNEIFDFFVNGEA